MMPIGAVPLTSLDGPPDQLVVVSRRKAACRHPCARTKAAEPRIHSAPLSRFAAIARGDGARLSPIWLWKTTRRKLMKPLPRPKPPPPPRPPRPPPPPPLAAWTTVPCPTAPTKIGRGLSGLSRSLADLTSPLKVSRHIRSIPLIGRTMPRDGAIIFSGPWRPMRRVVEKPGRAGKCMVGTRR